MRFTGGSLKGLAALNVLLARLPIADLRNLECLTVWFCDAKLLCRELIERTIR